METRRRPWVAIVAGLVVGSAVAVSLVLTGWLQVPAPRGDHDASAAFLAAWERSRTTTVVVESDFRRSMADGRVLYSAAELVQRPPDRIVRQFGGVSGVVGGKAVVCSTDAGARYSCVAGKDPERPLADELRDELETFRSYFRPVPVDPAATGVSGPGTTAPPPSLYRVVDAEPGCYEMFQQVEFPDPDYGSYAKFCFDEPTGAMRLLERHLAGGVVERLEAVSIRTAVQDADFVTTQDPEYDARLDLGPLPPPTAPAGTVPPSVARREMATWSNQALVIRANEAAAAGADTSRFVEEIVTRMRVGAMSVNDPAWVGPEGRPSPVGATVLRVLLESGYYAPA